MVIIVMGIIIALDVVLLLFVMWYGTKSNEHHVDSETSKAVAAMRALLQANEEQSEQEAQSQS